MESVIKAYITSGTSAIIGIAYRIYNVFSTLKNINPAYPSQEAVFTPGYFIYIIIALILLVLTITFLYKDAQMRKLTKAHALWGLLGVLGVFVYHIAFARKNPVKK